MKNNKASALEGIPAELIKYGVPTYKNYSTFGEEGSLDNPHAQKRA